MNFFTPSVLLEIAQRSKERYYTCNRKSPVVDPVHCLDNQRFDFNSLYALVSTHERIKHLRPSTLPIDAEKSLIVSNPSTSPAWKTLVFHLGVSTIHSEHVQLTSGTNWTVARALRHQKLPLLNEFIKNSFAILQYHDFKGPFVLLQPVIMQISQLYGDLLCMRTNSNSLAAFCRKSGLLFWHKVRAISLAFR